MNLGCVSYGMCRHLQEKLVHIGRGTRWSVASMDSQRVVGRFHVCDRFIPTDLKFLRSTFGHWELVCWLEDFWSLGLFAAVLHLIDDLAVALNGRVRQSRYGRSLEYLLRF